MPPKRRQTKSTGKQVSSLRRTLQRDRGGVVTVPADPPNYQALPWYKVIVGHQTTVSQGTTDILYLSELRGQLLSSQHLSVPTGSDIEIRLLMVQAWNLSGGTIIINLLDEDETSWFQANDSPGRNRWAKVGIRTPLSYSQKPFKPTSAAATMAYASIDTNGQSQSILWRATVLWRSTIGAASATSHNRVRRELQDISKFAERPE